jgi:hypothetical protein
MADFCHQCSLDMFGEDFGDLEGVGKGPLGPNEGYPVICERCGFILVDEKGRCVECDLLPGQVGHGPRRPRTVVPLPEEDLL